MKILSDFEETVIKINGTYFHIKLLHTVSNDKPIVIYKNYEWTIIKEGYELISDGNSLIIEGVTLESCYEILSTSDTEFNKKYDFFNLEVIFKEKNMPFTKELFVKKCCDAYNAHYGTDRSFNDVCNEIASELFDTYDICSMFTDSNERSVIIILE